ncbi:MAG TPA: hypothetical protein VN702_15365 [Acetobacteraceae bacterium]|nr:hypothetical protein [Acetobacteraceae bacterium]
MRRLDNAEANILRDGTHLRHKGRRGEAVFLEVSLHRGMRTEDFTGKREQRVQRWTAFFVLLNNALRGLGQFPADRTFIIW